MKALAERINALTPELRTLFDRIYRVTIETVAVELPPVVRQRFGDELSQQQIITVENIVLGQQTVFSLTRARRPEPLSASNTTPPDPFDTPIETAPVDQFGRLENQRAFSANNLFKAAPHHSLIVFKSHDPQQLGQDDISDGLMLASEWFAKIRTTQPASGCGLLIWNYLARAGASITHPHLQVFSLPNLPPRLAAERSLIEVYRKRYDSDYFTDAYIVHEALGLARTIGDLRLFVRLTPFKDREIMLFGDGLAGHEPVIARLLAAYRGLAESFDLLLLNQTDGLLPLGFAVDRGNLSRQNSDIGSLELYAFSVVAFDPFQFAKDFFSALGL